jgi:epoxyqueuosine reductase
MVSSGSGVLAIALVYFNYSAIFSIYMPLSTASSGKATDLDAATLRAWLGAKAVELGFDDLRITDTALGDASQKLQEWLAAGRHGHMDYMERHAELRSNPALLVPGALRVICVSMNYLSPDVDFGSELQGFGESNESLNFCLCARP